MSIDLTTIFKDMACSVQSVLKDEGPGLGKEVMQFINSNKQNIVELAQAKHNGDLTEEEFKIELEREKCVLEVQLIAMEIASKAAIQRAMNAAMTTLSSAISVAL